MLNVISVFIGGGIGSVLRYFVNHLYGKSVLCANCAMPLATLSVNIIGSFLIGFLYAIAIQKTGIPHQLRLGLTVGFCGGLTTFSAFSLEAYDLFNNGQTYAALGYIFSSVIICITVTMLGIYGGTLLGAYLAK